LSSKNRRDDSYFAASRRRNKKYMMIIIPIVGALAAIGIAAAILAQQGGPKVTFGPLGSAHEHAIFEVLLNGTPIDFSQGKYQVQSQYIHVENNDGTTLHRHATEVPVGEFFRSVGMSVDSSCFVTDDGTRYCEDGGSEQLRFYVNGQERSSISDYVLSEGDRMLIIYGNESQEQIQAALDRLEELQLQG
jgi:hypothetical protein